MVPPDIVVAVAVNVCIGDCWHCVWSPPLVGAGTEPDADTVLVFTTGVQLFGSDIPKV